MKQIAYLGLVGLLFSACAPHGAMQVPEQPKTLGDTLSLNSPNPQSIVNPHFGLILSDGQGGLRTAADVIVQVSQEEDARSVARDYQLTVKGSPVKNFWVLSRADQKDIAPEYASLQKDPRIKGVHWNHYNPAPAQELPAPVSVNDPFYAKQWHLTDLRMPEAWSYTTGSKNVKVAIVDCGFDMFHPEIKPNVYANPKELAGKPGVDDDGNGYIDDVSGVDYYNARSMSISGYRPLGPDSNIIIAGDTLSYHGSLSAGLIGGATNNGVGIAGMNWNVSLINVKTCGLQGSLTDADAWGLTYAARSGAKIVNWSIITKVNDPVIKAAIKELADSGAILFNSAGNVPEIDNNQASPTNYPSHWNLPNVVAVTIIDSNGAQHGCYGDTTVALSAPGWDIYSTNNSPGYRYDSGTSFSSPITAGAAALLWAYNPKLKWQDVRRILLATVRKEPAMAGKTITGGSLDVAAALAQVKAEMGVTAAKLANPSGRVWYENGALHSFELKSGTWEFINAKGEHAQSLKLQGTQNTPMNLSPGLWEMRQGNQILKFIVL